MSFWYSKAADADAHLRSLALLVCRALLECAPTEKQAKIALDLLGAMKIEHLGVPHENTSLGQCVEYAYFGKSIVSKPSSENTLRRLHAGIIALLPGIQKPSMTLEWLRHGTTVSSLQDRSRLQR